MHCSSREQGKVPCVNLTKLEGFYGTLCGEQRCIEKRKSMSVERSTTDSNLMFQVPSIQAGIWASRNRRFVLDFVKDPAAIIMQRALHA